MATASNLSIKAGSTYKKTGAISSGPSRSRYVARNDARRFYASEIVSALKEAPSCALPVKSACGKSPAGA
jgi:hypothetical protein